MRKLILTLIIILSAASVIYAKACAFSFLKEPVVGDPIFTNGFWLLPVQFETSVIHSAVWVGSAKATVKDNAISLQAFTTSPTFWGRPKKELYPGHVELGYLAPGEFSVFYVDPDGTKHLLRKIQIENIAGIQNKGVGQ